MVFLEKLVEISDRRFRFRSRDHRQAQRKRRAVQLRAGGHVDRPDPLRERRQTRGHTSEPGRFITIVFSLLATFSGKTDRFRPRPERFFTTLSAKRPLSLCHTRGGCSLPLRTGE